MSPTAMEKLGAYVARFPLTGCLGCSLEGRNVELVKQRTPGCQSSAFIVNRIASSSSHKVMSVDDDSRTRVPRELEEHKAQSLALILVTLASALTPRYHHNHHRSHTSHGPPPSRSLGREIAAVGVRLANDVIKRGAEVKEHRLTFAGPAFPVGKLISSPG